MTKSIILLSGGLDSLVSLGLKKEELNIELALTFDYGQKAFNQDLTASKNICEKMGWKHESNRLACKRHSHRFWLQRTLFR